MLPDKKNGMSLTYPRNIIGRKQTCVIAIKSKPGIHFQAANVTRRRVSVARSGDDLSKDTVKQKQTCVIAIKLGVNTKSE